MEKTPSAPNKHKIRSEATRTALLQAAEEVFARDGFEKASLNQIAEESGRTRGAVYEKFKTKENLFFELVENHTGKAIHEFERLTEQMKEHDFSSLLELLKSVYSNASDTRAAILDLELKLYALRHPESRARLRKAFEMSKETNDDAVREQLFGQLTRDHKKENEMALMALGPILSGLILESHFESQVFSETALRRVLGRIFDSLFPPAL